MLERNLSLNLSILGLASIERVVEHLPLTRHLAVLANIWKIVNNLVTTFYCFFRISRILCWLLANTRILTWRNRSIISLLLRGFLLFFGSLIIDVKAFVFWSLILIINVFDLNRLFRVLIIRKYRRTFEGELRQLQFFFFFYFQKIYVESKFRLPLSFLATLIWEL